MRADEHRESQGMLQYTRVGTSRRYTRPPRTIPPSESLLLLRFNEMLRPLARDYFPIAPINSLFGRSRLSSRDSRTSFLSDDPSATASTGELRDFYILLKAADIVQYLLWKLN